LGESHGKTKSLAFEFVGYYNTDNPFYVWTDFFKLVTMIKVIIESPFAENVQTNLEYGRAALRDSLMKGEAPIASHLLYTQKGILDDTIPEERARGIEAGLLWGKEADKTVVYTDLGISPGMSQGIERAKLEGREIEYRTIDFKRKMQS